jgi:hypothetical protein
LYYSAEENSNEFFLWSVARVRYSLFRKKKKKFITKDLKNKSKRVSKYFYEKGELVKGESYQDGKLKSLSEYSYENGLNKKTHIKNFTPGVELDFIVKYEYIR